MFKNKKVCLCEKKLTYLVAPVGCADDVAAVASLPDHWTPRHSGPILTNYLKQREENHNKVLKNITNGASVLNTEIDTKLRFLAKTLLTHIEQNQKDMECIVGKNDSEEDALSKEARDIALKEIFKLYSQRLLLTSTFKLEALGLERERTDGLKKMMRDQFQKLIAVGHRPPKDLLHDFDDRAYEINQQLLSNTRAYTELEAKLRVQTDESLTKIRSEINQLCLGVGPMARLHSAAPWSREDQRSRLRSISSLEKKDNQEGSIGHILKKFESFDERIARLVQAYKSAVTKVFAGFYDKLSDLEKDLGIHHQFVDSLNNVTEIVEVKELIDNSLRYLTTMINKKQNIPTRDQLEVTGNHMLSMQKSLWSLGECLRDTYTILHDAGHLWDAHILRQALAQKLTIAAVEDLMTSNDTTQLANEVMFNVALEQLRCMSDADKLHQHYELVTAMLARTSEMYKQHSETELGRLEEFMKLPPFLANILLAEFDCFLEKNPRQMVQSSGSAVIDSRSPIPSPPRIVSTSLGSPLPRAILQTELQEVALRNWRNGFLESFESNVSLVPKELTRQATLWVEQRATALHMRYSLKLVSHSVRLERVKAARDLRLTELRQHEARLESHLCAINELIDRLLADVSEFSSIEAPYLYPFCKWIERMQSNMDEFLAKDPLDAEVKRLKLSSYAPRLVKHRNLFEESLIAAVEAYKRQLEYRIQNTRISNVRFMSQIKLFNEGGNFSAQEATKACTALVKGAEALDACVNKVMDGLNQRRIQLLAQADQLLGPLQRIVEEVLKVGKGGQDKKKPPPAKKK